MRNLKRIFHFSILVSSMGFLLGLSGQERFVELEGYLNARATGSFSASDRNVRATLEKGTRGEILGRQRLSSGNYGLKVKILSGLHQGEVFWLYYNVKKPAVKVYERAPSDWSESIPVSRSAAETQRDQTAYRDVPLPPHRPAELPKKHGSTPPRRDGAMAAVQLIQGLDGKIRDATAPRSTPELCANCIGTAARGSHLLSEKEAKVPADRRMDAQCRRLVQSDGSYGDRGKILVETMNLPKYRKYYLRNNSLGDYCPRFSFLSDEDKIRAWAWFWTVLGQRESSCLLTKDHPTHYRDRRGRLRVLNPNRGYGIWAAERDANLRAWRGAACADISTFGGQARCAVETMARQQLARNQTASESDLKYWGPTYKSRQGELLPQLRRFKGCF